MKSEYQYYTTTVNKVNNKKQNICDFFTSPSQNITLAKEHTFNTPYEQDKNGKIHYYYHCAQLNNELFQSVKESTETHPLIKPKEHNHLYEWCYTLAPFIHCTPFNVNETQQNNEAKYNKKIIAFANHHLTINCTTRSPYPALFNYISHRFLSYIITEVVKRKYEKTPIIYLGKSLRELVCRLNILSNPSADKLKEIQKQLDLILKMCFTFNYSNSNKTSRQNVNNIPLLDSAENTEFIVNKDIQWQNAITISLEAANLIKSCAVPIARELTDTLTSVNHVFLLNYILYQNYNLILNECSSRSYDLKDLSVAIGADYDKFIASFKYLRKTKLFKDLRLDEFITYKNGYLTIESNEFLLLDGVTKFKEAKKSESSTSGGILKDNVRLKLINSSAYNELEIIAAETYTKKRIDKNVLIRNTNAYTLEVLANPSSYNSELVSLVQLLDDKNYKSFSENKAVVNDVKNLLYKLIKGKSTPKIPPQLKLIHDQMLNPGRCNIKLPGYNYLLYVMASDLKLIQNKVQHRKNLLNAPNLELFFSWLSFIVSGNLKGNLS